jgi:hypothetical protein
MGIPADGNWNEHPSRVATTITRVVRIGVAHHLCNGLGRLHRHSQGGVVDSSR